MTSLKARPSALTLDHVSKLHMDGPRQVAALDNVSLCVEPHEFVAIMGPSGAGKTTVLNVAGTLDTPDSGRVLVEGIDASIMSRDERARLRREHVGYVFQHFNLVPTLTVAENISLPLELGGIKARECRNHALEALEELQLVDLADRFPAEISGGQRQRVAIARALIGKRRLLLADEPTGALDTATGEQVMKLLRARVDSGAALLLVTHEPRFAAYADRVLYMRDGRLQEEQR
ncbi:ABC transporter ATP-binding protein [Corynebacterium diphtheriae]|uniref:ABC transporter ATP-binding protein n=1 Tax=Corynebacterium diphtheriae TaxID=1717 RepID=UPI0002F1DD3C|nr:ATP-binding cassette domain-containing protein [Corynebacterium diphtheriae]MBG9275780.1 ABC transporter ATP-binding protein [Corynebacterium diphtheriae bv. mitis]MBG9280153.1 ABC transporter ATP-binding protein [Corynebacterium diphtheriae bv. mitis]OJI03505.1 macrolide ABC transporter ATP-binding protein [Corynebacterium diphtheriae]OSQ08357.1 macrolide ABC transporter ATP-binding protein [Corynebacterium diphtheriae]OWM44521.1 macrolide ABC transporter ATP-binding protein [Corynebacteri